MLGSGSTVRIYFMVANLVAAVLVKTVAFPGRQRIFQRGSGNFDQTLEPAEERWIFQIQVDQHISVQAAGGDIADYHGSRFSELVSGFAVRNKIRRREHP